MNGVPYAIRFCSAPDGARIAYAQLGRGPPIVKTANWMTHLELDRSSPLWRHWHEELSQGRMLVTYDGRGYGLSDRDPPELSFDAMVDDLGTVIAASGLERVPLVGFCHGGPVAIAYAARHPERVSCLVLCGTYALGRARRETSAQDSAERDLLLKMIDVGWGQDSAAFRQVFASRAIPGASAALFTAYNELQRASASAQAAMRLTELFWHIDVRAQVPAVRCPTLVLHSLRDAVVPFEHGRLLAGAIAGARLVALDSVNHDLLADEPAWRVFVAEVREFLSEHDAPAAALGVGTLDALTARERAVLELLAQGEDNDHIAAALHVSEKTIRNHVTSIFAKLAVTSRSRAIVRARDAGFGRRPRG